MLRSQWERVQPKLNERFDPSELDRLKSVINYITLEKRSFAILDPHNYARYAGKVLGINIKISAFKDFWNRFHRWLEIYNDRLSKEFVNNDKVLFNLVNEPHTMPTETWRDAANGAIDAIRKNGAKQLILVPGNSEFKVK